MRFLFVAALLAALAYYAFPMVREWARPRLDAARARLQDALAPAMDAFRRLRDRLPR